jgi:hypothetical protein
LPFFYPPKNYVKSFYTNGQHFTENTLKKHKKLT